MGNFCRKCKKEYPKHESRGLAFCKVCGSALTTDINIVNGSPAVEERISTKSDFVRKLYSNATNNGGAHFTECDRCFKKYDFSKMKDFDHKPCFPPIGSSNKGQVLFVGANPRCNIGTEDEYFYRYPHKSEKNFLQFSIDGTYKNQYDCSMRLFNIPHYRIHQQCLSAMDSNWRLGRNSSVTELFMCGSEGTEIFETKNGLCECICATEYLTKYLKIVKPSIIVSFGSLTMQWFQTTFGQDLKKNTRFLSEVGPSEYSGDPSKDTISYLHSCYSRIEIVQGYHSSIVFSNHPRWMNIQDSERLMQTFRFVAKEANLRKNKV